MPVTLRHGKQGVSLLHEGKMLTRCYASENGKKASPFVAEALGVELPPPGASVKTVVGLGVLYRAISIASLDLRIPESYILLERLLAEAALQRGAGEEPAG